MMTQDLELQRKWTFRAHGKQAVFVKKPFESRRHVLTKAMLWALFLPTYPDLSVEISIGGRYKPDLVQLNGGGVPVFWAEAGRVDRRKMEALVRRFGSTHFVFAKWNQNLQPFQRMLAKAAASSRRSAPIDLISLPADSDERFIDPGGIIRIAIDEVKQVRC